MHPRSFPHFPDKLILKQRRRSRHQGINTQVQCLCWELGVHRRLVNGSMARSLVAKPPLSKFVTLGVNVPGAGTRSPAQKVTQNLDLERLQLVVVVEYNSSTSIETVIINVYFVQLSNGNRSGLPARC